MNILNIYHLFWKPLLFGNRLTTETNGYRVGSYYVHMYLVTLRGCETVLEAPKTEGFKAEDFKTPIKMSLFSHTYIK